MTLAGWARWASISGSTAKALCREGEGRRGDPVPLRRRSRGPSGLTLRSAPALGHAVHRAPDRSRHTARSHAAHPYGPPHAWAMPSSEHLIAAGILPDPTPLTRPLRQPDLVRALRDVDT